MGLIKKWFGKVKIPRFSVAVYGKLPCHKEYLHSGTDPSFVELKNVLDRGFDKRISAREPRPHVLPDRRFYVAGKTHYAACLFESDDGIRGFPFLMAAPLPARLSRQPLPVFWQALEQVWTYLEAYYADLRVQPDVTAFYNRVRNVVHELEPFAPESWPTSPTPIICAPGQTPESEHLSTFVVPREGFTATNLVLPENPAFILWPVDRWRRQVPGTTRAYFGKRGLSDLRIRLFRQEVLEGEDGEETAGAGVDRNLDAQGFEQPVAVAEQATPSTEPNDSENDAQDQADPETSTKTDTVPPFALPLPLRVDEAEQSDDQETKKMV